jgi:adenylate cyclase
MEKSVAILMAALSGYTALTETHGAVSSADLIDKYIHIGENCPVEACSNNVNFKLSFK